MQILIFSAITVVAFMIIVGWFAISTAHSELPIPSFIALIVYLVIIEAGFGTLSKIKAELVGVPPPTETASTNEVNHEVSQKISIRERLNMSELFVFGSWFFWIVTVGVFFGVTALSVHEKAFWSIGVILSYVIGVEFLFHVGLFSWVIHNPIYVLLMVIGFFLGGTLFVFPKWKWYIEDIKEDTDVLLNKYIADVSRNRTCPEGYTYARPGEKKHEELKEIIETAKRGELHPLAMPGFITYAQNIDARLSSNLVPRIADHKEKVLSWMCFWPFVLFWTFFDDIIRKIFLSIYNRIANILQNMANKTFADYIAKRDEGILRKEALEKAQENNK